MTVSMTVVLAMICIPLAGCSDEPDSFEDVGERVDDAIDETGDAIEDTADEVEDAADTTTGGS